MASHPPRGFGFQSKVDDERRSAWGGRDLNEAAESPSAEPMHIEQDQVQKAAPPSQLHHPHPQQQDPEQVQTQGQGQGQGRGHRAREGQDKNTLVHSSLLPDSIDAREKPWLEGGVFNFGGAPMKMAGTGMGANNDSFCSFQPLPAERPFRGNNHNQRSRATPAMSDASDPSLYLHLLARSTGRDNAEFHLPGEDRDAATSKGLPGKDRREIVGPTNKDQAMAALNPQQLQLLAALYQSTSRQNGTAQGSIDPFDLNTEGPQGTGTRGTPLGDLNRPPGSSFSGRRARTPEPAMSGLGGAPLTFNPGEGDRDMMKARISRRGSLDKDLVNNASFGVPRHRSCQQKPGSWPTNSSFESAGDGGPLGDVLPGAGASALGAGALQGFGLHALGPREDSAPCKEDTMDGERRALPTSQGARKGRGRRAGVAPEPKAKVLVGEEAQGALRMQWALQNLGGMQDLFGGMLDDFGGVGRAMSGSMMSASMSRGSGENRCTEQRMTIEDIDGGYEAESQGGNPPGAGKGPGQDSHGAHAGDRTVGQSARGMRRSPLKRLSPTAGLQGRLLAAAGGLTQASGEGGGSRQKEQTGAGQDGEEGAPPDHRGGGGGSGGSGESKRQGGPVADMGHSSARRRTDPGCFPEILPGIDLSRPAQRNDEGAREGAKEGDGGGVFGFGVHGAGPQGLGPMEACLREIQNEAATMGLESLSPAEQAAGTREAAAPEVPGRMGALGGLGPTSGASGQGEKEREREREKERAREGGELARGDDDEEDDDDEDDESQSHTEMPGGRGCNRHMPDDAESRGAAPCALQQTRGAGAAAGRVQGGGRVGGCAEGGCRGASAALTWHQGSSPMEQDSQGRMVRAQNMGVAGGAGRNWDIGSNSSSGSGGHANRGQGLPLTGGVFDPSPFDSPEKFLQSRLLQLAKALESGDLRLFNDRFKWLSQFSNPRGQPIHRLVHYQLHGLFLRCTGTGFSAFNTPTFRNPQELTAARLWFHRTSPFPRFAHISMTSALCVALAGRRQVHIVEIGNIMAAQWPTVLRLLASGAPRNPDGTPQLSLRVTVLNTTTLVCPGRTDLKELYSSREHRQLLLEAAASCGVRAEMHEVDLESETLLETLVSVGRPSTMGAQEEAVAVCSALDMDYFLDSTVADPGIRDTILHWVSSLQLRVFALVGFDVNANNLPFLTRFRNCIEHLHTFLEASQAACPGEDREMLHVIEETLLARGVLNMTSCEGAQRRLRPQSVELWQDSMRSAGLVPGRLHGVDIVHNMMVSFPLGFGLRVEKSSIHLTWQSKPCLHFSPWVPQVVALPPSERPQLGGF